jgi:tRNA-splicing ligase RtcB
MKKISENIISWCPNLDELAFQQAKNVEAHPCRFGNVVILPDSHGGYGMPIGCVVALEDSISPNMVGNDIGCGMGSVKTNLKEITREDLQTLFNKINAKIPTGKHYHKEPQEDEIFDDKRWELSEICKIQKNKARLQIGTLGGGNHFIEIQKGNDGYIYIMLHSGSRNLGAQVAEHYNKIATELCKGFRQNKVANDQLAFFPKQHELFYKYLLEMNLALDFAYKNRQLMLKNIKNEFQSVFPDIEFLNEINIHHNYASQETYFNRNLWLHRKGATLANETTIGLIPGSQGSHSYIVKGKGNLESFCSCSHGAGRVLSRTQAIKNLDFEKEVAILNNQGIIHSIKKQEDLEEATSAYKNIDEVMEAQKDLVEIIVELTPLAVVKE